MRDLITVITAVLGVLLVLGGGTVVVMRALANTPKTAPGASGDDITASVPARASNAPSRVLRAAWSMPEADRLIGWGIVLLILSAIAAGAMSLEFGAQAGN